MAPPGDVSRGRNGVGRIDAGQNETKDGRRRSGEMREWGACQSNYGPRSQIDAKLDLPPLPCNKIPAPPHFGHVSGGGELTKHTN